MKRGVSASDPCSSVESVLTSPLCALAARLPLLPDWLRRPKPLRKPLPPRACDDDALLVAACPLFPRPPRIHGIMAARLPRLPEPDRRPCDDEGTRLSAAAAAAAAAAPPPPTAGGAAPSLFSSDCGMPAQPLAASASKLSLVAADEYGARPPYSGCRGKGCCHVGDAAGCDTGGWRAAAASSLLWRDEMERPSIRSKKPSPTGSACVSSPFLQAGHTRKRCGGNGGSVRLLVCAMACIPAPKASRQHGRAKHASKSRGEEEGGGGTLSEEHATRTRWGHHAASPWPAGSRACVGWM